MSSATQRLRQSLTVQISATTLAEIKNRIAPDGGRPEGAQMAASLMFKNMAATLQIANVKRATAEKPTKPKTTAANRAALARLNAPETQTAKNARRLANLNKTK